MLCDDARASEAQGDPGAAVAVIVDQKFRSPAAGNRLWLELEAHTAHAVRPDADQVWMLRAQQRKIGIWKYLSATQGKTIGTASVRSSPAQYGRHAYLYTERCRGLQ